jgi:hypothetical protein
MYREIAGADEFKRPAETEKAQLTRLLKQFVGKPDIREEPAWKDWAKRNPHRWADIVHVHVDFDIDEDNVRLLRDAKARFKENMTQQCEDWKNAPQSFEDDVGANYTSWRTTLLKGRLQLVDWLRRWVLVLNETEPNALVRLDEFFLSENWKQAPFAYLWVRLWAKVAEMARNPKGGRKPQLGDYYDAQVLSYYAPYCDAMLIDGGFRAIACDPKVDVEGHFNTRCFSEQNRDGFLSYLDDVERAMPLLHKEALAFVYPTNGVVHLPQTLAQHHGR